jgi:subtilisin family serine protease
MPNGHTVSPTRAAIYRQIIVTLPEAGTLGAARKKLYAALSDVDHTPRGAIPEIRAELIELKPHEDVAAVSAHLVHLGVAAFAEQNRVLRGAAIVDDPLYPQQWAFGRIGAERAWLRTRSVLPPGGEGVIVAVVDTGIQTAHRDLAAHLWADAAGHHGRNLIHDNYDVYDGDGHGTRLAGTIGACSNNTLGIAAAEWPLRLMAVKFTDARNPPTAYTGARAIVWAAENKAQIITVAWGVGIPFEALRNAIKLADTRKALVVAAAGNDGLDNDNNKLRTYPASYQGCSNLISVMASTRHDDKPWFSNYGRQTVHLAAPGVRILTTDTYLGVEQWRAYSGTSAACAYVSYAAALIKTMNPGWTSEEIRRHLVASVERSRWLKCISKGRLSLERAVLGPFTITAPAAGTVWPKATNVQVKWARIYQTGKPTTRIKVEISKNGAPYTVLAPSVPNTGSCTVLAPNAVIGAAKLRIRSVQAPPFYDESKVFKVE